VLLVEHDRLFRQELSDLLVRAGYEVESVADGAEALAWLAHVALPDAVVIDTVLPGVNAAAFRRLQLESPRFRLVPTIALSVVRTPPGLEDVTFSAVVAKTVAVDQLIEVLDRLCRTA
jgi:CheY-like chemotaxis protein